MAETVELRALCPASFERLFQRLNSAYEAGKVKAFRADRQAFTFVVETDDPEAWRIRRDIADGDCRTPETR